MSITFPLHMMSSKIDDRRCSLILFRRWTPPSLKDCHKGRYLWTDAFGVINLITLFKVTRERHYLDIAKILIKAVHDDLGRTRDHKRRLPGASNRQPLAGGLRIGKVQENGLDGDGQFHHHLTLWMFALNRMTQAGAGRKYNEMAICLAEIIHEKFVYDKGTTRPKMYWKMAVDLSEPLVKSEGNLDAISGHVIYR
jgi:hypothetical protein